MPTTRMASSTYGSQSVSKPEANMSRRPLSKFTNRASRRPVFAMFFQSDFFSISPKRLQAARDSSSWPGMTVMYADTSETTPWLLPLPDFLVIWLIFFHSPLIQKNFDLFSNFRSSYYLGIFLSYFPTEYSSVCIRIANDSKFSLGTYGHRI